MNKPTLTWLRARACAEKAGRRRTAADDTIRFPPGEHKPAHSFASAVNPPSARVRRSGGAR